MSFQKSLTSSVQERISADLALKVMTANSSQQIGRTARELHAYLSDPETLCTPDFTIRRYLQAFHANLLTDLGPLPDLVKSDKNVPWPQESVNMLSRKLTLLSKEQGAAISTTEWLRYFSGSVPSDREKVFRMAFTLKMDVSQTMDLLLACGKEPYTTRYPLDMICLFCQRKPGTYTWAQARQMLDQFMSRRTPADEELAAPTENATQQFHADLDALFERSLQGSNAQDALVDYMVEHSAEFISFRDTDKDVFLPGYSRRRSAQFKRLSQYLAVLYPHFFKPRTEEDTTGDSKKMDPKQWKHQIKYVIDPKTGMLSLPKLVQAMFWASSWNDLEWHKKAPKGSFEDNMRMFCRNYKQHIDKVNRLYTGGNNIAFFDRRDALLFIFFLISGYMKLLAFDDYDASVRIQKLREMTASGRRFDEAVGHVLAQLDSLYDDREDPGKFFDGLCTCFNTILSQMGHANLYLPAQFDRFVLLALLSEDPEDLASLIMSEAERDNLDLPFEKKPTLPGRHT